jgi:hypothetical protein
MTQSLFNPPFFTAFFQGKIATGAKMFFYETATLAPIDIFDNGGDPLPNPISADLFGQFVPIYIGDDVGEYRVQLQTSTGSVIDDVDPADNILGELLSPDGSDKINFLQGGGGAVPRTLQSKNRDIVSVKDFGAKGDGAADDTAALDATYAYARSIGAAVYAPAGTYLTSGNSIVWTSTSPFRLYGDNILGTVFKKIGVTTDPVLTLTGTGLLDIYADFQEFSCDGINISTDAMKVTDCARLTFTRVGTSRATVGWDCSGTLITDFVKCFAKSCTNGWKTREGSVTSNLINFQSCEIRGCTSWGVDIGGGEAISFKDCEIAANGTAGNTSTGGMVIRNTVGAAIGEGSVTISGCYFELNLGNGLFVENASNLCLQVEETGFYNTEAGRAAIIGSGGQIRSCTLRNIKAAGASDVIAVNAVNSVIIGGFVHGYNDTSLHTVRLGATTATSDFAVQTNEFFGFASAGNEMYIADNNIIAGGSAADTSFYKYGSGRVRFWSNGSVPLTYQSNTVGFLGAAPSGPFTLAPVASDPATTQTLANSLRGLLVTFGLGV